MIKNRVYLKNYDNISEEMKYVTKSIVRLKILASLYKQPQTMKELKAITGVSYSSISSNMHEMELRGFVYRDSKRYYLSNSFRLHINDILELESLMDVINDFFNILDGHVIDMIPNESILELFLLGKASLIESDDVDAYRTSNYIENALSVANHVKCILPFYYGTFNECLNGLVAQNKPVEAMVSEDVFVKYEINSKIRKLSSFSRKNNFLLISTDKVMILGLFKEDGRFDQNRLLISRSWDAIKWGDDLFENFKIENK